MLLFYFFSIYFGVAASYSRLDVKDDPTASGPGNFRFLNRNSIAYRVHSLPDVSNKFDIGELYSGLIPVYDDPSRALFFVFQPVTTHSAVNDLVIWFNGGPGCSSLEGFFQENGKFLWQPGTHEVMFNEFSWVNLTNMLWIEQPVGTGFSIGKVNLTSEQEVATEVVSWFKNFHKIFNIENFRIYITGESYAGLYVPYVASAMLDQNDTKQFNVKGALLYDPVIGQQNNVLETTIVPFVQNNANLFNLPSQLLDKLSAKQTSCGYQAYLDRYLAFPPGGHQPTNIRVNNSCAVNNEVTIAYENVNPCANSYNIALLCPTLWDVLRGTEPYFNRQGVKKAMHAPAHVTWVECSGRPLARDTSLPPIEGVLPKVIEATNRVLISNGDLDNNVLTNSTLLNIQNMTFNGKLGFQTRPSTPIDIKLKYKHGPYAFRRPQGIMGIQHYERGLLWAETFQSGHQQPQYQPRSSYRHLQWLLGHIETL